MCGGDDLTDRQQELLPLLEDGGKRPSVRGEQDVGGWRLKVIPAQGGFRDDHAAG